MNLSFTARGIGTNYIDLSQAASIANRRFYRQGINWTVAGFTITTAGTTAPGSVTICKAPTTWVMHNAWKKSFAMWNKMNDQVFEDAGAESIKSRFHDFKVYLNEGHVGSIMQTGLVPADGEQLMPTDCSYNIAAPGAWDYSQVVIPNDPTTGVTATFDLKIVGDSDAAGVANQSKGLIQGYAMSRARPQPFDPNVPDSATTPEENWFNQLFDDGEQLDTLRDDLQDDNDSPPYPVGTPGSALEYYPGSDLQLPGTEVVGYAIIGGQSATGSITAQRSIKGGLFPCGLVEVKSNLPGLSASHYDLIVHLVPGEHRGYLCEPMLDV